MNNHNGFIVSFDNVPGNIFCGKKQGVFNTNTSNSVRASITVVQNTTGRKGFKLTPLIRFKNEERKTILNNKKLEGFLYNKRQIVSPKNKMYFKCDKSLGSVWNKWAKTSKEELKDYVTANGNYILSIPNTCRYYTTAYSGVLKRQGQITLRFNNEDVYYYVFCMINSSFAYWYWRLFDGGITYSKSLLLSLPLFFKKLSKEDCTINQQFVSFNIKNVRQLNPTIAGKMYFKNLLYSKVKKYYFT